MSVSKQNTPCHQFAPITSKYILFNYSSKKTKPEGVPTPKPLQGEWLRLCTTSEAHSAPVPTGCWRGAPTSRALGSSDCSLPAVAMRRGDSRKWFVRVNHKPVFYEWQEEVWVSQKPPSCQLPVFVFNLQYNTSIICCCRTVQNVDNGCFLEPLYTEGVSLAVAGVNRGELDLTLVIKSVNCKYLQNCFVCILCWCCS